MVMITVIRGFGFQLPPGAQPRVMLACQGREGKVGHLWDSRALGMLSLWDPFF